MAPSGGPRGESGSVIGIPSPRWSTQESSPFQGSRHSAAFPLTEPPVAIAGDEIVDRVPEPPWEEDEGVEQAVHASEAPADSKDSRGFRVIPISLHEYHGVEVGGGDSSGIRDSSPGLGLKGGESKYVSLVPLHHESDGGIAEMAKAIEEDDLLVSRFRHGTRGGRSSQARRGEERWPIRSFTSNPPGPGTVLPRRSGEATPRCHYHILREEGFDYSGFRCGSKTEVSMAMSLLVPLIPAVSSVT